MFEWFKKLRTVAKRFALPAREARDAPRSDGKIDLRPYTPEPKVFLGQLAYLKLTQFEILTNELKFSPNTHYKAELGEAAAKSFEKYRAIASILASQGVDATDAMEPFTERIGNFHSRTTGIDWYETVIKVYLVYGLLDDFYRRLAIGLTPALRKQVEDALADDTFEQFAKRVLIESMGESEQLKSRLALWGRRLMGDVLLELRAAFDNRKLAGIAKGAKLSVEQERQVNLSAYSKLEPLVSEMISVHTLRMDALGLSA
ncbi:MAG: ferritin-like fold-containing protein [Rhodoluna sp.]|nr:ferritin-like fold-containing protein [Rhodoluna sp.]